MTIWKLLTSLDHPVGSDQTARSS